MSTHSIKFTSDITSCQSISDVCFSEPAVIAKSTIILEVKPWDDETDMKEMEKNVRSVATDGLVWGACK